MARTLLLFLAYLTAAVLLLGVAPVERVLVEPWTRLNASAAAVLASVVGVETRAMGTYLYSGSASLNVLNGCNGVHAMAILVSAILAAPAPWARRLLGVVAGGAVLLVVNIVRVVSLVVVVRHFPERTELFHSYIWQTLIVLCAFGLFLAWATYLSGVRPAATAGRGSG